MEFQKTGWCLTKKIKQSDCPSLQQICFVNFQILLLSAMQRHKFNNMALERICF